MKFAIRTVIVVVLCLFLAACHHASPAHPTKTVTPTSGIGTALAIRTDQNA